MVIINIILFGIIATFIISVLIIFRSLIQKNYDSCYKQMCHEGKAVLSIGCDGLLGGTSSTGYVQEACIDCPYYIMNNINKN